MHPLRVPCSMAGARPATTNRRANCKPSWLVVAPIAGAMQSNNLPYNRRKDTRTMCGIIGYVGPQGTDVTTILLDGLRKLEYRGYDSAGIAVLTSTGSLEVRR